MKIFDEASEVTKEMWNSDLVCIWPLKTPPTSNDLKRISVFSLRVGRRLSREEVLDLMQPQGRA